MVHIEGYPNSKIFIDCRVTVNIMPVSVMKALRRSTDELIPSGITISSFVGDKSQTKRVFPLEVNIAGRNHMTAFFIVDSKTEYNALLGRDWIHQTNCIPSSLYQVLIFWDGKLVMVHPADTQPFETNMIQARYYDDHVGYITLQGFNAEGRSTRISVQKVIESYHEIPGLNRALVKHELRIKPGCNNLLDDSRLLNAGFIRTARYIDWLGNIVPVLKKNGALRICIDF
ncbi:uncharacterized protein [Malus domestica]|uniref:uncharacterized protein n=1 Tax=Malus domestica TaxID=3750 RepID=UPI00397663A2